MWLGAKQDRNRCHCMCMAWDHFAILLNSQPKPLTHILTILKVTLLPFGTRTLNVVQFRYLHTFESGGFRLDDYGVIGFHIIND